MLCDNCNKNEATIHYTEVINGVKSEHHLCSECMQELDNGREGEFPFSRLIRGILSSHFAGNGQGLNPASQIKCSKCGMTYDEFTRIGKFGCAECYGVFGPLIMDNIKKIQGSSTHTGKKYRNQQENEQETEILLSTPAGRQPVKKNSEEDRILQLDGQLKAALKVEDYDEAARLRDEIKLLKERVGKDA